MNKQSIASMLAVAGLLAALPAAWAAPGDPTPPAAPAAAPAASTPVRGQVTAVDATAKTVTVQDRNQNTTIMHVSDATKYYTDVTGALSDVKVGQTVRIIGQADGTTITARMIQVVPVEEASLPAGGRPGGGQGGGGRRFGTQGVVATVTPTMTITTADKQTDTVQTDTTTRVTTPHAGTLADVKPDANINALTSGTDTVTATLIHVRAAGGYGGGRPGGGAGAPAGGAPTPAGQ